MAPVSRIVVASGVAALAVVLQGCGDSKKDDTKAKCSTMKVSECGKFHLLDPADAGKDCSGKTCVAADSKTCCKEQALCSSLKATECGFGFGKNASQDKVHCAGLTCQPYENSTQKGDQETCCEATEVSCSTIKAAECAANRLPDPTKEKSNCTGTKCAEDCCKTKALCNTLPKDGCGANYTLKPDAAKLYCAELKCVPYKNTTEIGDRDNCCDKTKTGDFFYA